MADCNHADALRAGSRFCGACGSAMPPGAAEPSATHRLPARGSAALMHPQAPGLAPVAADTSQAMWAHLAPLLLYVAGLATFGVLALLVWLPPLLILNGQGRRSRFVRAHAAASLNFQITQILYSLVGGVVGVGILFAVAAASPTAGAVALGFDVVWLVASVVFYLVVMVIASMRAARGDLYRYPLTARFIR